MYSTGAGLFTVITTNRVLRIHANSESQIRTACAEVGIAILGINRDTDD